MSIFILKGNYLKIEGYNPYTGNYICRIDNIKTLFPEDLESRYINLPCYIYPFLRKVTLEYKIPPLLWNEELKLHYHVVHGDRYYIFRSTDRTSEDGTVTKRLVSSGDDYSGGYKYKIYKTPCFHNIEEEMHKIYKCSQLRFIYLTDSSTNPDIGICECVETSALFRIEKNLIEPKVII